MSRHPLKQGVVLRMVGIPEGQVEAERKRLKSEGNFFESSIVVPELTLEKLSAIYARLNLTYGASLVAEQDLEDLRFGIHRAVGKYHQHKELVSIPRQITALKKLESALSALVAFSKLAPGGLVDGAAFARVAMVARKLVDLKVDPNIDSAYDRIEVLQKALDPIRQAAAAVREELVSFKPKGGRPRVEWDDIFSTTVEMVLQRAGGMTGVRADPDPDRPGLLLDLATELSAFIPKAVQAPTLKARTKRLLAAKRRRRVRDRKGDRRGVK